MDLKPLAIFSELLSMRTFVVYNEISNIIFEKKKRDMFHYFRIILYSTTLICGTACKIYITKLGKSEGVIISTVKIAHLSSRIPLVVVCYLLSNFYADTTVTFLNTMLKTNVEIERIGGKINYKHTRTVAYLLFSTNCFKLLLLIVPYLVLDKWTIIDYLDCIIFTVPEFLITCITMQWISYLCFLRQQLMSLNKLLLIIWPLNSTPMEEKCSIGNRNKNSYNRHLRISSPWSVIHNIAQIFSVLHSQTNKINAAFLLELLIILFYLFLSATYDSFMICHMIKHNVKLNIRNIVLEALHLLCFVELILPCVMVKQEVNKMIDKLHYININEKMDQEINEEINALTLQTHHQVIEFCAFGALPLDGTLIYSIFGALTTYLVVLLQFDIKV